GAPQPIGQTQLYGAHAKWSAQALLPEASDEALRYVRTLACRAAATARTPPAGPVHLNMPFREPLVPVRGEMTLGSDRIAWLGRADGRPYVEVAPPTLAPDQSVLEGLARDLPDPERG